jgi:hypothetical protein
MASTSFTIINTQFTIYAGLPICIFGLIGNLINLRILFATRSNASSFLLFVSSFFNIIALARGLLPRILAIAFNIDASTTSIIWCKSRSFLIDISSPLPLKHASALPLFTDFVYHVEVQYGVIEVN